MRQISAIAAGLLLLAGAIWWVSRMEPPEPIEVENARIRLVPGGGPMAGYMRLSNNTENVVRLVGAETPAFGSVMIHRTVIENGRARMEHQSGGVTITPGDSVEFKPRDLHLMLMRPQAELSVGDTVDIALEFEGGGPAGEGLGVARLDPHPEGQGGAGPRQGRLVGAAGMAGDTAENPGGAGDRAAAHRSGRGRGDRPSSPRRRRGHGPARRARWSAPTARFPGR